MEATGAENGHRPGKPIQYDKTVAAMAGTADGALMFALPGQSLQEWEQDVITIVGLEVDQLSTYPMFSFPYSDLGHTKGIRHLLRPLILMGLVKRVNDTFCVTKSGAYWIHRLQNEYSLSYINHLWGSCRKEPWPEEVTL